MAAAEPLPIPDGGGRPETASPPQPSRELTEPPAGLDTGTRSPVRRSPEDDLAGRIRLQTAFRLALASALLASTAIIQWRASLEFVQNYDFRPLYFVAAFIYATSIPAALGTRRIRNITGLTGLATGLFLVDIAVTTAIVHLTGDADSAFTFLYILTILNASAVLFRRGVLLTAAASSIAYGLLVDLSYFGWVKPFAPLLIGGTPMTSTEAFYRVGAHVFGFLLTGFLSSYLAETLRRTGQQLQETAIDLRQLKALTKNIVENIGSGLLTVDRAGRITSFNKSAEEITGRAFLGVFGTPVGHLFPMVSERLGRGVTPDGRRHEESYVHPDGTTRSLGFSYSPLRNDDGVEIGTIVIFQDLTELREMETRLKREERLAAVGRLAAGIAHEIRNPLASISGSIEMLRSSLDAEAEDARLMEIILRETDRLDGLITEFLDYVKPLRRNPSDIDVHSVVRETADAVSATDVGRNVSFVLPPAGAAGTIRGDRDHLKQILWNLFLNASQAMAGKGTVTIRAESSRLGVKGEVLVLEIADQGPGIPAEAIPRIFEPFFTTKKTGTGLGLAIVHKIVEAHHGHIEVDSPPGEGAKFRVILPRNDVLS